MNYIQQIVIGCILGDGYIMKSGCLQIEHSAKQKEYVEWKSGSPKGTIVNQKKSLAMINVLGVLTRANVFILKPYLKN